MYQNLVGLQNWRSFLMTKENDNVWLYVKQSATDVLWFGPNNSTVQGMSQLYLYFLQSGGHRTVNIATFLFLFHISLPSLFEFIVCVLFFQSGGHWTAFFLTSTGFDLFHSLPSVDDRPSFIPPQPVQDERLADVKKFEKYMTPDSILWWTRFFDPLQQIPGEVIYPPDGMQLKFLFTFRVLTILLGTSATKSREHGCGSR